MFRIFVLSCTAVDTAAPHGTSADPPNSQPGALNYVQEAANPRKAQTTGSTLVLFLYSLPTSLRTTQTPSFIHKSPRSAPVVKTWCSWLSQVKSCIRGTTVSLHPVCTIHLQGRRIRARSSDFIQPATRGSQ